MHVQGLLEDNLPIPESESFAEYVAIAEKPSTGSEVVSVSFPIQNLLFFNSFEIYFSVGRLLLFR